MGCIFSCFKNNNGRVETLLLTTDYCYICNQRLTFNEYKKHIVECNKNNSINQSLKKNGEL